MCNTQNMSSELTDSGQIEMLNIYTGAKNLSNRKQKEEKKNV